MSFAGRILTEGALAKSLKAVQLIKIESAFCAIPSALQAWRDSVSTVILSVLQAGQTKGFSVD
jgi:hypothetical protein